MLSRAPHRLCLLAWIAGGLLGLFVAGAADAGDCGCEIHCDVVSVKLGSHQCDCSRTGGTTWFDGIHFLHARAKKLFDWRFRLSHRFLADNRLCDDACDAALLDDLMAPEDELLDGLDRAEEHLDSPQETTSTSLPIPVSQPSSQIRSTELETQTVIPPEADLSSELFDSTSGSNQGSARQGSVSEELQYFGSGGGQRLLLTPASR